MVDREATMVTGATAFFESEVAAGERYTQGELLGQGGMGEVRLTSDRVIGRDVARKVMRAGDDAGGRARFLREARVQGQLEHPSVVPVYDIGTDEHGAAYFTMKRVKGLTLKDILKGHKEGDRAMIAGYGRRRLISAMAQVCLCIAYAHSRGVVHRDLKPANVMLGSYGEVYVLDWGVAKVDDDDDSIPPSKLISGEQSLVPGGGAMTQTGSLIGTPGYVAPEQAKGEAASPLADVYSLGVMLFEVLALEPMHPRTSIDDVLLSTIQRGGCKPSERNPKEPVPPELDELCAKATQIDASLRLPSARAMHDAIEQYLDGVRDAEQRTKLAGEHLSAAKTALDRAAKKENVEENRVEALKHLARAVVLDPDDPTTLKTVLEIVIASPDELPKEARAELEEAETKARTRAAGLVARGQLMWFAVAMAILMVGIHSWPLYGGLVFSVVLTAVAGFATAKLGARGVRPHLLAVSAFLAVAMSTFAIGPFTFTAGLAGAMASMLVTSLRTRGSMRRLIFGLTMASVFVPVLLSAIGVLPPFYEFRGDAMIIKPVLMNFPPFLTPILLSSSALAQMFVPTLIAGAGVDALLDAERRSFAQAWRLRQMLPRAA